MSDNFDLQKFLKENKSLENLNPIMKSLNDKETKKTLTESVDEKLTKSSLRDQIREMVLAEMGGDSEIEDELYEAKEDEEEIDAEEIDAEVTDEEEPTSDVELAAAGATGDSKELINHLMSSLEVAKTMGNEKLTTQVMNTLKFAIDQSMAS